MENYTMNSRFEKFLSLLNHNNFDAAVLNPGASFHYLTGLDFHLMERPTVLIIRADGKAALILPKLEVSRAECLPFDVSLFHYEDDPAVWQEQFNLAAKYLGLSNEKIAVESSRLRHLELNYLQTISSELNFATGNAIFDHLRLQKDEAEIKNMKVAAEIA